MGTGKIQKGVGVGELGVRGNPSMDKNPVSGGGGGGRG